MKIYHNPRCSKSRQTLQLIEDQGIEPQVIRYLEEPPSRQELVEIISLLGIKPEELVRKSETLFREKFRQKQMNDEEWIDAMIRYPKLIQRPIVIKGERAVVGRPPENVKQLF